MITLRRIVLILLLFGIAAESTWAQRVSQQRAADVPGVWYQGRFFGYAPQTRRGDRSQRFEREPDTGRELHNAPRHDTAIELATYHDDDELIDETPDDYPIEYGGEWQSEWERGPRHGGPADGEESLVWGEAEYLLWWTRGMSTPPLATTSLNGTIQDQAGILGLPGTTILSGGTRLLDDSRSGGRFTLGVWLDDYHDRAVEVTYLTLEEDGSTFVGSDADRSILARPFTDIQGGTSDARLIVYPGLVDGLLSTETETRFQTLDIFYRRVIRRWSGSRLDLVLGYRYANLDDLLLVSESTRSLSGATQGATIDLFDRFDTENRFNGGTIGVKFLKQSYGCWSLEGVANVALGSTRSKARVTGETITTTALGDSATTPNGLLTQQTNIGSYGRSKFSTVSEFGVSLRRNFTDHLSARVGYTFLFWTNVMRAGEQVDLDLNPSQIPPGTLDGPPRPAFPFATTNFWAQGLNFGLEYQY
ncbi:MAG: BBP7 family outer membrane beta-barrel protein [Pirellulales bacterium]